MMVMIIFTAKAQRTLRNVIQSLLLGAPGVLRGSKWIRIDGWESESLPLVQDGIIPENSPLTNYITFDQDVVSHTA
jgi:hypothetical protein